VRATFRVLTCCGVVSVGLCRVFVRSTLTFGVCGNDANRFYAQMAPSSISSAESPSPELRASTLQSLVEGDLFLDGVAPSDAGVAGARAAEPNASRPSEESTDMVATAATSGGGTATKSYPMLICESQFVSLVCSRNALSWKLRQCVTLVGALLATYSSGSTSHIGERPDDSFCVASGGLEPNAEHNGRPKGVVSSQGLAQLLHECKASSSVDDGDSGAGDPAGKRQDRWPTAAVAQLDQGLSNLRQAVERVLLPLGFSCPPLPASSGFVVRPRPVVLSVPCLFVLCVVWAVHAMYLLAGAAPWLFVCGRALLCPGAPEILRRGVLVM